VVRHETVLGWHEEELLLSDLHHCSTDQMACTRFLHY
jgi:hypothetical protein